MHKSNFYHPEMEFTKVIFLSWDRIHRKSFSSHEMEFINKSHFLSPEIEIHKSHFPLLRWNAKKSFFISWEWMHKSHFPLLRWNSQRSFWQRSGRWAWLFKGVDFSKIFKISKYHGHRTWISFPKLRRRGWGLFTFFNLMLVTAKNRTFLFLY